MMSTRRSLFVFGALLAVGVLLAPQVAFAQEPPTTVTATAGTVTGTDATASIGFDQNSSAAASTPPIAGYEIGYVAGATWSGTPSIAERFSYIPVNSQAITRDVSGLAPSTQYVFAVRSYASNGSTSPWVFGSSNASRITTGTATLLAAPTGFNVTTGNAAGEVNASWTAVPGGDRVLDPVDAAGRERVDRAPGDGRQYIHRHDFRPCGRQPQLPDSHDELGRHWSLHR